MSTLTQNLNLVKPAQTDNADIDVINANMDLIDIAVAAKETPAGAQAKANTAETNAKGYTDTKLAALIAAAPAALDTLKELADALGDDPNFATTITNLIATKADGTTVTAHLADTAPHGATALATPNKLALRDANGNLVFNLPISGQNPNLIFNPSFRFGSAGWDGIGSNGFVITPGAYGEGCYLSNSYSQPSAAQVNSHSTTRVPAIAGTTLILSGEMFAVGVTVGGISLEWFAYDSGGTVIMGGAVSAVNGQGWTKYSTTFTAPANTAAIQIACYVSANTTSTNVAWRKIKLEAGSIATTFSDDNTLNTLQYASVLRSALIPGEIPEMYIPFFNSVTTTSSTATTAGANLLGSPRVLNTNWPSGTQFALEASLSSQGGSATAYVGIWDTTAGALVAASQVSTASTGLTEARTGAFSLTPGHIYYITAWSSNGSYVANIQSANLIVYPQ